MNTDKKTKQEKPIIIVSGATGFLGQKLCEKFTQSGYDVRALSRQKPLKKANCDYPTFYCNLPNQIDLQVFDGKIHAFIHCAYETHFRDSKTTKAVNIEGSQFLLNLCRSKNVHKFVFISSMSAHPDALSLYGQTKLYVESLLDQNRDLIIRPGFIIGNGGIFQRLANTIKKSPVIPLFYGGKQKVQTIFIEDLTQGILNAVSQNLAGILTLSEAGPVEISEFYSAIAHSLEISPVFVKVPGGIALALLKFCEIMKLPLPISSENLLGLKALRSFETWPDLNKVNIKPTIMKESLDRLYGN